MTNQHQDRIYASPLEDIAGFRFDQAVVSVFPDMSKRSVPGYATIIHMVGQIAERFATPNSHLYDLGCSLGAASLAMRHRVGCTGVRIIAVDNSADMINTCRLVMDADSGEIPVTLLCEDILRTPINNASVCVLNFTLQFIAPVQREQLLRRICDGLNPGGVLVLSEKIAFADAHQNQLQTDLHHHFKRANGYSDLEIAQKRAALENVLIPETMSRHRERLLNAGFNSAEPWFQCFNFTSIIAIK